MQWCRTLQLNVDNIIAFNLDGRFSPIPNKIDLSIEAFLHLAVTNRSIAFLLISIPY